MVAVRKICKRCGKDASHPSYSRKTPCYQCLAVYKQAWRLKQKEKKNEQELGPSPTETKVGNDLNA